VTVAQVAFEAFEAGDSRFDLITFVASLHHMDVPTTSFPGQLCAAGCTTAISCAGGSRSAIHLCHCGFSGCGPVKRVGGSH